MEEKRTERDEREPEHAAPEQSEPTPTPADWWYHEVGGKYIDVIT